MHQKWMEELPFLLAKEHLMEWARRYWGNRYALTKKSKKKSDLKRRHFVHLLSLSLSL